MVTKSKTTKASAANKSVKKKTRANPAGPVRKKPGLIGVDPLAWMKQQDSQPQQDQLAAAAVDEEISGENNVPGVEPEAAHEKQGQQPDAGVSTVKINNKFGIRNANECYTQLQQALDRNQDVSLDFEDVKTVDTAALQMLVAFASEAKTRGMVVQWQHPPELLTQSVELLGLVNELDLNRES